MEIRSYYNNITTGDNKNKIDVFSEGHTEEPQVFL